MNDDADAFTRALDDQLQASGMRQADLARATRVSPAYINRMRRGGTVSAKWVNLICEVTQADSQRRAALLHAAAERHGYQISSTPAGVFSPDEIVQLAALQTAGHLHPYTCPNRGDGKHRDVYGDLGALVPTIRGWVCPFCDYIQLPRKQNPA